MFFRKGFEILNLLRMVRLHLRHRCVEHRFTSRTDFLVCFRGGSQGFVIPGHGGNVSIDDGLGTHMLRMDVRRPLEPRVS